MASENFLTVREKSAKSQRFFFDLVGGKAPRLYLDDCFRLGDRTIQTDKDITIKEKALY